MGMGFWRYERQQRKKPRPYLQNSREVLGNHEYCYQRDNVFKFNEYYGHWQLTTKNRAYPNILFVKKNYQKDFLEKNTIFTTDFFPGFFIPDLPDEVVELQFFLLSQFNFSRIATIPAQFHQLRNIPHPGFPPLCPWDKRHRGHCFMDCLAMYFSGEYEK
jgi:hypothetical protein